MNSVFKSVKLDNYIMKPYYRAFILLFAVAAAVGVLTKIPAITVTVVLIISAPFNGTYFSAYEKNNLDKLYGVLPLRKLDVVTGRYLYA
ncbi:MAG: ABC-2 transporter permease, partial [Bacillota bacterium]|nr:ABC-2 transporter permease [Bacillota bacterium]